MSRKKAPSIAARPRCMMSEKRARVTQLPLLSASCSPAAWRAAWAAATRRASASAARPSCNACSPHLRRNAPARHHQCQWRSGALCRHRPCRWSPTACRILPGRSPAFSPASIGRRHTRRRSNGSSACRAIVRSCRKIWSRVCTRRALAAGMPLACARSGEWRHPVVGAVAGRAARGFAARADRRRACTRSRSGPRGTASPSPTGRPSRSIRSSTSTRRKMRHAPKRSPRNIRTPDRPRRTQVASSIRNGPRA